MLEPRTKEAWQRLEPGLPSTVNNNNSKEGLKSAQICVPAMESRWTPAQWREQLTEVATVHKDDRPGRVSGLD
ncbi:unnamed protein product, partial [Nesidiocoris tenuis]